MEDEIEDEEDNKQPSEPLKPAPINSQRIAIVLDEIILEINSGKLRKNLYGKINKFRDKLLVIRKSNLDPIIATEVSMLLRDKVLQIINDMVLDHPKEKPLKTHATGVVKLIHKQFVYTYKGKLPGIRLPGQRSSKDTCLPTIPTNTAFSYSAEQ